MITYATADEAQHALARQQRRAGGIAPDTPMVRRRCMIR